MNNYFELKKLFFHQLSRIIDFTNAKIIYDNYDYLFYDILDLKIQKIRHFTQRKMNVIYENCIEDFLRLAKDDFKYIFIKGYFLAKQLYNPIEDRHSSDIDILIKEEDVFKCDYVLQSLGFKKEKSAYKNQNNHCTLSEEIKKYHLVYSKNVNNESVVIEIHSSIINPSLLFNIKNETFFSKTKEYDLNGFKANLLSNENNLILLCLHFIKHFSVEFIQYSFWNLPKHINIQNLFDIFLLLHNYKTEFDWNLVYTISKNNGIEKYIYFVLYIINRIDGNIINSTVLEDLRKRISNSKIYYNNRSPKYENIGMGKFPWLIDECMNTLIANKNKLFIKDIPFPLAKIISEQESKSFSINKEYKFDFYDTNSNDLISQIFFTFKETEIKICTKIYKKKLCLYEKQGNLYDKDGVEFVFIDDRIHHTLLTLTEESKIAISSYNKPSTINYIPIKLEYLKVFFSFDFCCSYDELGITQKNKNYLFNIGMTISDENKKVQKYHFHIFGKDNDFWCLKDLGNICRQ